MRESSSGGTSSIFCAGDKIAKVKQEKLENGFQEVTYLLA